MTIEQAHRIVEEIENTFGYDTKVSAKEYSGRWMYGASVGALYLGRATDMVKIGYIAANLVSDDTMEEDDLPNRMDSLGLGIVLY